MREVAGDLLLTQADDIVHGCNAQGVMGSGVAKAIRARYPSCYETYRTSVEQMTLHPSLFPTLLGIDIQYFDASDSRTIHNLITQERYGSDGLKYARYWAVVDGMNRILENSPWIREIAIPRIGCGLGGLRWDVLRELLLEVEERHVNLEFIVHNL